MDGPEIIHLGAMDGGKHKLIYRKPDTMLITDASFSATFKKAYNDLGQNSEALAALEGQLARMASVADRHGLIIEALHPHVEAFHANRTNAPGYYGPFDLYDLDFEKAQKTLLTWMKRYGMRPGGEFDEHQWAEQRADGKWYCRTNGHLLSDNRPDEAGHCPVEGCTAGR